MNFNTLTRMTTALVLMSALSLTSTAQDHSQHAAVVAKQSADALVLSTPGRRAASQEIIVGADGSINVTWVETMSDKAVMSEHNLRAAAQNQGHDHGSHGAPAQTEVKVGNDVMFARSTDGGRTFSKPVRVNSTPGEVRGVNGNKPRVIIDSKGVIHIAWVAANQTPKAFGLDIRYTHSSNNGRTFLPARTVNVHQTPLDPVTGMGNTHAFVGMTLTPKGALHFFWIDTRYMKDAKGSAALVTTTTTDGGKTFTKERELFDTGICGCCQIDALTATDGTMYLSWRYVYENNARETVVMRSTDTGKTWEKPVRLSPKDWIIEGCPHKPSALALDKDGRLFVTWYTEAEKPRGVYFAMTEDKGKTFSAPLLLHPDAKLSDYPEITIARDGALHAIWSDRVGDTRKLFMRTSRDHGKTFGPVTPVEAPAGANYPVIETTADGKLLVAWQQDGQIFLRTFGELTAQR